MRSFNRRFRVLGMLAALLAMVATSVFSTGSFTSPVQAATSVFSAGSFTNQVQGVTVCRTTTGKLDVAFLIDNTDSMKSVIDIAIRESDTIVSQLRGLVADTNFAVAAFGDNPTSVAPRDYAFKLFSDLS